MISYIDYYINERIQTKNGCHTYNTGWHPWVEL